jgi:hypothetical protein
MNIQLDETESKIREIDNRVNRLEKINDNYASKYGCYNAGIYKLIQNLMDQRDIIKTGGN